VGGTIMHTHQFISERIREFAQEMRREMTPMEKKFWYRGVRDRMLGYKFNRQYPIDDKYIADFVCLEKKLIIEIDGIQHFYDREYDDSRTVYLQKFGFNVVRFWNNQIKYNLGGCLQVVSDILNNDSFEKRLQRFLGKIDRGELLAPTTRDA
jgi:very-short-patch-repair endonuclease